MPRRDSSRLQESNFAILAWGCANGAGTKRLACDLRGPAARVMTADTQTNPDDIGDTTAEPKRRFKFPTAFTVLFFVLVLVWILTFIIPPGSYSYVSCDGGSPKPVPGTFGAVKVDLSIQERLYDLWVSPVNGLYGVRTPSEVVPDPSPDLLKKGQAACGTAAGQQVPAEIVTAPGNTGPYNSGDLAGAVQVFFFVLAIGAFITVTIKTGALDAGIGRVTDRFRKRGLLLIVILMLIFSVGRDHTTGGVRGLPVMIGPGTTTLRTKLPTGVLCLGCWGGQQPGTRRHRREPDGARRRKTRPGQRPGRRCGVRPVADPGTGSGFPAGRAVSSARCWSAGGLQRSRHSTPPGTDGITRARVTIADTEDKKRGRRIIISHLLSRVPYKPLAPRDITLPKRQRPRGYTEPDLPLRHIPTAVLAGWDAGARVGGVLLTSDGEIDHPVFSAGGPEPGP